jgi:hypothetical protein
MRWVDVADDTVAEWAARNVQLQVMTRDEWRALPPGERPRLGEASGRVLSGVAFRGDGCRWLRVAMVDADAESPRWTIWDMRDRPTPLMVGISDLRLAQAIAALAADSRAVRLGLGAMMVLAAAAQAVGEVWRRERPAVGR